MYYYSNELAHYGLKGMKWGQRRWQYDDGRFNDAGKARYFGKNSSHRPDSVRVLQGDKPKGESQSSQSNFDKDKAKKIAKNVAIGAVIVGGTVLVAYGGYKIHQAGGFSQVSKNLQEKMRETKLENLKLKQEFKADMASIKAEGKTRLAEIGKDTKTELARIKEDTKTELAKIKEEGKLARLTNKISPDGKIDSKYLDNYGKGLSEAETKLKDVISHPWDFTPAERSSALMAVNDRREYISKSLGIKLKPVSDEGLLTGSKVPYGWDIYENNRLAQGASKQQVYNELLSIQGRKTVPGYETIPSKYGGQAWHVNMDEARKVIDSASVKEYKPVDIVSSIRSTVNSSSNNGTSISTNKVKTTAEIVREYKKEHPNTTLTPSKIVENYKGAAKAVSSTAKSVASSTKTAASTAKSVAGSVKSSASNVPKLTLTPNTINAGTNFVAQATKSYATMKQINAENSRSNGKAKKGQKAVDDYTKELLKKGA